MKKIYLHFTLCALLLCFLQSHAQNLYPVRLSATGFDANNLTVKLGDTVQIFVVSGGTQRLTTTGIVPAPSMAIDTVIGENTGRTGVYYVPKALGDYTFQTDNINTPTFHLTVVADVPLTYTVRVSITGFDVDQMTMQVGDTVNIEVVSGGSRRIYTVGTVPTPSKTVDTTINEAPGHSGIWYVPMAPGTYTFRADLPLTATDDMTITVLPATVAGVDESVFYEGINVYPNPVKSEMNVTLNPSYNYTMTVTGLTGNTFLTQQASGNSGAFMDVSNLAKGTYLLSISNNQAKKPKAIKFIKE